MQTRIKPLVVALAFALAANSHTVWAADENKAAVPDEKISGETKAADESVLTEMSPIQVRGTNDTSYTAKNATTATKTDTPLMETPMNVQVITEQVLQDQHATTLDQALTNVSGVISNSFAQGQETLYLRGFTMNTTLRNGFRIEDNSTGLNTLTNVESIEVLKGPAAILYGAIEPGGVVNLTTKQPQATAAYSVEQSIGSWDHYLTNLNATGPVNADKSVLFQVNASYDTTHSYIDGVFDQKTFIAPTLKWIINSNTQATIEASHTHNPFVFDNAQALPYVNGQFVHVPVSTNLGLAIPYVVDANFLQLRLAHQFNEQWSAKFQVGSNRATANGVNPSLASIAPSGNTYIAAGYLNGTVSAANTTGSSLDVVGHLDIAGMKHTVLLGTDYYSTNKPLTGWGATGGYSVDMLNPVYPTNLAGIYPDPSLGTFTFDTKIVDTGLYVQDQIELSHNMFATAGLRQDKIDISGSSPFATVVPLTESAVTPRLGMLWKAQNWLSVYGNYAGSLTPNGGTDYIGNPLLSSHAKQFETGIKAENPGGTLRATLAYFDLTKTNVPTTDPNLAHLLVNPGAQVAIGELGSKGVEMDIQGDLQPNWKVIVAYAHNDTTVLQSNDSGCTYTGSFCQGSRFANVPSNMTSIWTTYELKHELQGWKIGGGVTGQGSSTNQSNTIYYPGFEVVNAMASYTSKTKAGKVTLQINVNNIFNKYYFTGNYSNGTTSGWATVNIGAPRNAMATAKLEF